MDPSYTSSIRQSPDAGNHTDLQDLCQLAISQAFEIEKASLAAVVRLNSSVLDSCNNLFWCAPPFGNLQEAASQVIACCIELQMNWLNLLTPHASSGRTVESGSRIPPAEVLEHSMDVAIGAHHVVPGSGLAIVAGNQVPAAEMLQRRDEAGEEVVDEVGISQAA
jgi:hypothetical protein